MTIKLPQQRTVTLTPEDISYSYETFKQLRRQLQESCDRTMRIDPGINVEKTEIINTLLEELYRFVEELEQQVREDLHYFQQEIETDDVPTMKVKHSARDTKG